MLSGHSDPVRRLIASPDGELLLGITEREMVLWDVRSRQPIRFFPGHPDLSDPFGVGHIMPLEAAFSPNGEVLVTASFSQGGMTNEPLILWDVDTGAKRAVLSGVNGCRSVAFLSETTFLSACDAGVQVWEVGRQQPVQTFYQPNQGGHPVETLAVAPNAAIIATVDMNVSAGQLGEDSRRIRLWEWRNGTVAAIADWQTSAEIAHLEFSADETLLLAQSFDGDVQVWDWMNGAQQGAIAAPAGIDPFNRIAPALSPDRQILVGEFQAGEVVSFPNGAIVRDVLVPRQGPSSAYAFVGDFLAQAGGLATYPNPVVRLWSTDGTGDAQDDLLGNPDYRVLSLTNNWNYPTDGPHSSIFGEDPETVALVGVVPLQSLSDEPGNPEVMTEVVEAGGDRQIIRITVNGLRDDSIQGERFWVELAPYSTDQWKVVWAGAQQRCYPGRGSQDWGVELCR